jgi:phosphatidylglycerophosphate synthase
LPSEALARSRKRRNGYEVVCEAVFRPLAHPLVLVFARLRVPPAAIVVAAGVAGIAGAVELSRGSLLLAAGLVQLKTLLDNADGQLARLTGQTSAFGRYLDSEVDLLVNAALFAAIGRHAGMPLAGLIGFVALTSVLSLNFNASRLSRAATAEPEDASDKLSLSLVRAVYRVVYAPQDRFAEWIVARRPALTSARWVSVLANLGMSTQLAALGVCLVFGAPLVFAWIAVGEAAVITLALLPQRAPIKKAAVEETA